MRGTPAWNAFAAAALTHELGQTSGDPYKAAARHADRMQQEAGGSGHAFPVTSATVEITAPGATEIPQTVPDQVKPQPSPPQEPPRKRGRPTKKR